MRKNVDLLHGSVSGSITKLALPIMGTSIIQTAYNLTDMIWIGRVGSNAVAAVGAAGMFMWFSGGLAMLSLIGGQVLTGQSLGAGNRKKASAYAACSLQLGVIMAVAYGFICITFRKSLIGFFNLTNPKVISDAEVYLSITCGLVFFSFLNRVISGLLTATGNTMLTFKSTTAGLLANFLLDPILIFGVGPAPTLGASGAAIATVFAQMIVFVIFFFHIYQDPVLFSKKYFFGRPKLQYIKEIFKIGFPVAIKQMGFSFISMNISRLVASWGDAAIAVQKVGTQVESLSWLASGGFGSAVTAFTAQNYGATQERRVKQGYRSSLVIISLWGAFTTFLLTVFPRQLFSLFIREEPVIPLGAAYLRILGVSQLFMGTETLSAGVFHGFGKAMPPSFISIFFTLLRIPLAFLLSSTALGLDGIWWTLTITSVLKGTILPFWLLIFMHRLFKKTGQKEGTL